MDHLAYYDAGCELTPGVSRPKIWLRRQFRRVLLPASQISEFGAGATAAAKASAQDAKSPPTASSTSFDSPSASGSLAKAGSQQSIVPFIGGASPVAGAVSRNALWAMGTALFALLGGFMLA